MTIEERIKENEKLQGKRVRIMRGRRKGEIGKVMQAGVDWVSVDVPDDCLILSPSSVVLA